MMAGEPSAAAAGAVVEEPKGLSLSLDQIIKEKSPASRKDGQRQPGMHTEQRRNSFQDRGRGRGGRGMDRGHFNNNGFGPQGWQVGWM
jgi:hypothetical protein